MPRTVSPHTLIRDIGEKLNQLSKVIGNMENQSRHAEPPVDEALRVLMKAVAAPKGRARPATSFSANDRAPRPVRETTRRAVSSDYKTASGRLTESGKRQLERLLEEGLSTSEIAREMDLTWRAVNEQKKKWATEQSRRQAEAEEAAHREEEARKAEEKRQKRLANLKQNHKPANGNEKHEDRAEGDNGESTNATDENNHKEPENA